VRRPADAFLPPPHIIIQRCCPNDMLLLQLPRHSKHLPAMYTNKTNGSYVCPPSGTRVVERKQSSQGGIPYLVELCQIVIYMWQNGEDMRAPWLIQLRHQSKIPLSPHVQVMDSSISSKRECSPNAGFG
jgi:hypothetical protein